MARIPFRPRPEGETNLGYDRVLRISSPESQKLRDLQRVNPATRMAFEKALHRMDSKSVQNTSSYPTSEPNVASGDVAHNADCDTVRAFGVGRRELAPDRMSRLQDMASAIHCDSRASLPGLGGSRCNNDNLEILTSAEELVRAPEEFEPNDDSQRLWGDVLGGDVSDDSAEGPHTETSATGSANPEQSGLLLSTSANFDADALDPHQASRIGAPAERVDSIAAIWKHVADMEAREPQKTWQFTLQQGNNPDISVTLQSSGSNAWNVNVLVGKQSKQQLSRFLGDLKESLNRTSDSIDSVIFQEEVV